MKSKLILAIGIIIGSFIGLAPAAHATQLTLVKEVAGGEATATDWVLTADGTDANDLFGAGWVSGLVTPDTFQLSESAGPPAYTAGDWDCVGGGVLDGQSLTLSEGDVVTCTIINTYVPAVVIFDSDFALPSMPVGDGAGTPVCVDDLSGLLVAGCDVTITADEIDPASVQRRVDGACTVGSMIRAINVDGSVVCGPDTNATTICAGGQFLNGDGSCDPVVVDTDTTLSDGEVDAFVANNGYGDITGITTSSNSGLSGGVTSGTATLSVDPTDFMEPPGISASLNGTIDSHYITAAETVASRSLSAPVAGVIVAIATANYVYCGSLSSTNTRCDLYHTLATSPVTSAISGSYQECSFLYTGGAPAPQNYEYRTCTVMASFSVNAGTSTIYWQAGVGDEINDSVYISDGDLMTIFIPN